LKPFNLSRGENGIPIYTCDYCQGQFRGHNSIVYHTRRHIGDYPYRCGTCGYAEVSKCALNQHLLNHRHSGAILLRYARDNTQNLDDIATEIMAEVKRENDLGDEPPKKRKKTFEEKNIERQDEFIDSHELERRVAALLGQNRLNLASENEDNIDQLPELPDHCHHYVVNSNSGLIPQHFKPYDELDHSSFQCNFCQEIHDCSTSIIYHCRKHIGDYPYRCTECGHAELSKAAISSHLIEKGHMGFVLAKNNGRDIDDIQQVFPTKFNEIDSTESCETDSLTSEDESEKNPNINMILWYVRQSEKKISKCSFTWEFCTKCKSAFWNREMFRDHFCL